MKLTKNFDSSEFACKDGTAVPSKYIPNLQNLVNQLQIIRDHTGLPIVVNSGYRTDKHNKSVGGSPRSQHLTASASDIRCPGISVKDLLKLVDSLIKQGKIKIGGIGIYKTFIHLDIRSSSARWAA